MTTCNSQTVWGKEPMMSRSCACPMAETCFSTTIPLKVANAACTNCERSHWMIKSFSIGPSSCGLCSISRFAKHQMSVSIVSQKLVCCARRRSQPRVGWMLTADSNVLHASGYITTKRFYTRHDLETVITPETYEKVFKWVLRGLNEKVKQKSMPMAVDDFSLQATQLQGFARLTNSRLAISEA